VLETKYLARSSALDSNLSPGANSPLSICERNSAETCIYAGVPEITVIFLPYPSQLARTVNPTYLQQPAEDLALASWLPVSKGLTPHGFRHGHKVWMDEDQIADVLKSDRLGHEEPGMRGVYGHVSAAMRADIKASLQARWEDSLRERARFSPVSAVPLLNQLLLAGVEPDSGPRLQAKIEPRASLRPRRRSARP
jgi:hypothetical protein